MKKRCYLFVSDTRLAVASTWLTIVSTCLSVVFTWLTVVPVLWAVEPEVFPFQASITGAFIPDEPVRVALPAELIAETSRDFADLRLFDDRNQAIPYVIYAQQSPKWKLEVFTFNLLAYEESGNIRTLIIECPKHQDAVPEHQNAVPEHQDTIPAHQDAIPEHQDTVNEIHLDTSHLDTAINEILLDTTACNFKTRVQIYSSNNRQDWCKLTDDMIFDFSSRVNLRKTNIDIPPSTARYFKLILQAEDALDSGAP